MASVTKLINGVVVTLNPAVFQSYGPSGAQIEFTSHEGTSASDPIGIGFSRPVSRFAFNIIGITFEGHVTRVFNTNGQVIATIRTDARQNDLGSGGSTETVVYTNDDEPISGIELIPADADYIGYSGLTVTAAPGFELPPPVIAPTSPPTSVPVPTPAPPPIVVLPPIVLPPTPPPQANPPPPTMAPIRYINLADVVIIDAVVVDRQYVKGSMRNIAPAKFNVRNTSAEVEIQVALAGLAGVSFDPSNFTLAKNGSQDITINFDVPTVDGLPEGINTVNTAINLNSNTAVFDPFPPPPLPVPIPPPAPPQFPPPVAPPIPQLPPTIIESLPPVSVAEPPRVIPPIDDSVRQPQPLPPVLISAPLPPPQVIPPPDDSVRQPLPPVVVVPSPPPILIPWVDGTDNQLKYGQPPDTWVLDPFGGEWYPPNDPYVLRDFDRAIRPGFNGGVVNVPPPVLIAPSPLPPPPPPAPPPPPPYIPPPDNSFSGGGGGGGGGNNKFFDDGNGTIRDLQTDFLI